MWQVIRRQRLPQPRWLKELAVELGLAVDRTNQLKEVFSAHAVQ